MSCEPFTSASPWTAYPAQLRRARVSTTDTYRILAESRHCLNLPGGYEPLTHFGGMAGLIRSE